MKKLTGNFRMSQISVKNFGFVGERYYPEIDCSLNLSATQRKIKILGVTCKFRKFSNS